MNKIKIPFFAVVITVFVIILTTTGIIRLCKQPASANKEGDVGEYKISYATEVLQVDNIVDNVPFLSEHFLWSATRRESLIRSFCGQKCRGITRISTRAERLKSL